MAGGTRRLDIVYHIDTAQADQQAASFNQRQADREKKLLSDAEVAEKAKQKLAEKTNREKIAAAMKAQEAEAQASRAAVAGAEKSAEAHKKANAAIAEGAAAVGKFGASLLGLAGAQQIVGVLSDTFASIRMSAFKAAEDVMRMRGAVRELQALRGEMGTTGGGVSHVFNIARQTLQSTEDVQAMESAGLGVGELALKTDKDRAEFEKAMVAAGRFQVLEGGDAGAYGQMMGQIALQSKGGINAADMEAKAFRLFQIQQPGGFRTMSQAIGQYAKLNPLVQNGIYSPEEAMGLLSAFSVSSPDEASTKMQQFTRSVLAGRLKARGQQVSPDVDVAKSFEYMKGIGITDKDNALGMGRKIAADMAKQEASAKKAGKKFNAYEYLMLQGFANQEDRLAIMDFAGLVNTDRFSKIEQAMNGKLEQGAITSRFNERLKRDNFLKGRAVELSEQGATLKGGLQEEPLVLAQKAAFARLKAQGKIGGTFEEWQAIERGGLGGSVQAGIQDMFYGGYHSQVTREMMHGLEAERKRLGLPAPGVFASGSAHEYELRYARTVQEGGGDVTRGVADDLKAAAADIRAAAAEQRKAAERNPVPPALPARPPNQAVRVP